MPPHLGCLRWEERPDGQLGTMTPVDLLRMLNEPFESIESLQAPLYLQDDTGTLVGGAASLMGRSAAAHRTRHSGAW